jgi:outer membrane protein assembly factor BamB
MVNGWEHASTAAPRRVAHLFVAACVALSAVGVVAVRTGTPEGLIVDAEPTPRDVTAWTRRLRAPALASGPVGASTVHLSTGDGRVEALDGDTGRVRWTFDDGHAVAWGLTRREDVLYVAGGDGFARALDAETGAQRWRFDPRAGRTMTLPPVVAGTRVFTSSAIYPRGRILALDAATGREQWRATVPRPPYYGLVAAGDLLLAALGDEVAALDQASGRVRWRYRSEAPAFVAALPGAVAVAAAAEVTVLEEATGAPRWTLRLDARVRERPVAVGGLVAVALWDGTLSAFDARDGALRWRCACAATSAPAAADGVVVVGTSAGAVALDAATGARRWIVSLPAPVHAPPAVAGDVVYVTTSDDVRRLSPRR